MIAVTGDWMFLAVFTVIVAAAIILERRTR